MDDTSPTQLMSPLEQFPKTKSTLIGTLCAWSSVPRLRSVDTNVEMNVPNLPVQSLWTGVEPGSVSFRSIILSREGSQTSGEF